jgi:hypothetical protein
LSICSSAQSVADISSGLRSIDGTDSLFVRGFSRKNDFRFNYTSQRYLLNYGSKHKNSSGSGKYSNVSDLVGIGFTYKFIDLDISFSLPQSQVLQTGLQNLKLFRLAGSFSSRNWTVRGYWLEGTGMVVSDASGEFVSGPSVYMLNLGVQYTRYFNSKKFSFRAASFQNEVQLKTAGSFLLRVEPFFRRLGMGTQLVPTSLDLPASYGEQAGLKYVYAPGLVLQPGYGFNWTSANTRWFISPMIFAGGGVALNVYNGNSGEKTKMSVEWKGSAVLNLGYNGPRMYVSLRSSYELDYFSLNPSFFHTADLRLGVTVGYRFTAMEKFIPESLF